MKKIFKLIFTISFLTIFIRPSYSQTRSNVFLENSSDNNFARELLAAKYSNNANQNKNSWTMVQTPSRRYFMTDVFFIDSLYGWGCHSGVGIGIVKTSNSGYSWDSVQFSPLGDALTSIYFIDRNTGWTCGYESVIRKTTNGGNNWIVQDYLDLARYHTIYFKDQNTGYIAGNSNNSRAIILKTTNSGTNWNVIREDTGTFISQIWRQFWIDSNIAWFGGYDYLVRTTDGGITFKNMLPYLSDSSYGCWGIFFLNNDTGWISGNNIHSNNIFKTTNGGYNWVFQNNPITNYSFPQINDIKFISPDTGWAAAFLGSIIKTTNGGNNWEFDLDTNVLLSHLWTFQKSKIWCAADEGQIWYKIIDKTVSINSLNNIVDGYKLYQNYPNPFNPSTKIIYDLPKSNWVILRVYDVLGKEVSTLVNQKQNIGTYEIIFNKGKISSGLYYYKLISGNFVETKKMIVLK